MTRLCIDTSAYSNFRRGERRVIAHLDEARWIGVPSVVLGELWAGFLTGSRAERNAVQLQEFLAHPVVEVVPIDENVARIYGDIFADLRAQGRPLPTNDLWIAATAASIGATVLTYDAHFQAIARVAAVVLPPLR